MTEKLFFLSLLHLFGFMHLGFLRNVLHALILSERERGENPSLVPPVDSSLAKEIFIYTEGRGSSERRGHRSARDSIPDAEGEQLRAQSPNSLGLNSSWASYSVEQSE